LNNASNVNANWLLSGGGVTYTFGPLSIAGQTLAVTNTTQFNTGSTTNSVVVGATTLTGNPTFDVSTTASAGWTGVTTLSLAALNDSGIARVITVTGNGRLVLTANATSYLGGFVVDGSTLQVTNDLYRGTATTGTGVTLQNPGTLRLGGSVTIGSTKSIALGAVGGTIDLPGSGGTLTLGTGQLSGTTPLTITGTSGTFPFVVSGYPGRVVLAAANAGFSGNVTVASGGLQLKDIGALGTSPSVVVQSGAAFGVAGTAGNLDLSSLVTMQPGSVFFFGEMNTDSGVTPTPGGTGLAPAVVYNIDSCRSNNVPASYGTLNFGASSTFSCRTFGDSTFNTPMTLAAGVGNSTITFQPNDDAGYRGGFQLGGAISDGLDGNLALAAIGRTGAGGWVSLNVTNSYSGGTTANARSIIIGNAAGVFGSSAVVASGGIVRISIASALNVSQTVLVNNSGGLGRGVNSVIDSAILDSTSTGKIYIDMLNYNQPLDFTATPLTGMTLGGSDLNSGNVSFTGVFTTDDNYPSYNFTYLNFNDATFTFNSHQATSRRPSRTTERWWAAVRLTPSPTAPP
jgi:hypothetical protein